METSRDAAAAATVDILWRRAATPPRLRRGYSVETSDRDVDIPRFESATTSKVSIAARRYNMTCRECLGRAERDALWDRDGIHLTEAGYDAFGVAVFVALEGILGLGDRRLRGADPPEIRAPPRVLDRPP